MQSSGIKRHSIDLAGHKTSVSLEDEFWKSLREIAGGRGPKPQASPSEARTPKSQTGTVERRD